MSLPYLLHVHRRNFNSIAGLIFYFLVVGINPAQAQTSATKTAANVNAAEQETAARLQYLIELPLEDLLKVPVKSASLIPEKSQASAATTSTVSRAEWQSRQASRIGEAIEHFPGVSILPFRFGAQAVAIRGFSGSNLPRGLSVRWDDVPLNGYSNGSALVSVPNIDLNALEKIEMVRGPASALYGSDAFHGVLSLYSLSNAPNLVEANFGNNQLYSLSGHAEVPLLSSAKTTITAAASGQGDLSSSYRYTDPVTGNQGEGQRQYQYDSQTAIINVSNAETSTFKYRWGMYWNQFDGDRFVGPGRAQTPGVSALRGQDWSGNQSDFVMTNGAIIFDTGSNLTTEINAYFWDADVQQNTKVPRMGGIGENIVDVGDQRYGVNVVLRKNDSDAATQWALSVGHNLSAVDQGHTIVLAPDNSVLASVDEQFADKERYINNLLLEIKTAVRNDTVKFVYGGRVDDYSDFGTQASPRLGVIFTPSSDWTYKLLYGQAFRAPTAFETYGVGNFKGNPNLNPEVIDTIEWSATTYAHNWTAGITLFSSRWRDGIVRAPSTDPNFNLEFRNVDNNHSHGVEAQYQLQSKHWLADISASYVHSENDTTGEDYLAFPSVIIDAALTYQASDDLRFSLNNRIQMEASAGIDYGFGDDEKLPTYWRVDFSVEKDLSKQLLLSFGVRNLLNRDNYVSSLFNAEGGVPDEEARVLASVRYRMP